MIVKIWKKSKMNRDKIYSTFFSLIISISFHYSTYFSSILSISYHYSTCLSSIFSTSFYYSTSFSYHSIPSFLHIFHLLGCETRWKIWKKSKLNVKMIGKIWKKSKLNRDTIHIRKHFVPNGEWTLHPTKIRVTLSLYEWKENQNCQLPMCTIKDESYARN
jgi:hypothetical protein